MTTLLLTGATGLLGRALLPCLQNFASEHALAGLQSPFKLLAPGREEMDFTQPEQLYEKVCRLQPQIIVNAAGYTAVEQAEQEEEQANLINGTAVHALARAAHAVGALLVHYSTDYVFDGQPAPPVQPYRETDTPCPLNAYGRSKLLGERYIQASGCDALIMRTAWLYGVQGKHFVNTILQKALQGEAISVVNDQRGTPTSVRQLAQLTRMLLIEAQSRRQKGIFKSVLLHATAAGEASWYEFACEIVAQAQTLATDEIIKQALSACVVSMKSSQDGAHESAIISTRMPNMRQTVFAHRPPYSVLCNEALEKYLANSSYSTLCTERCHWKLELARTLFARIY